MLLSTLNCKPIRKYVSRQSGDQGWQWSTQRWTEFVTPPHPLNDFKIQKYHKNEANFKE